MLRLRLIALPLALLGLFAFVAADLADARTGGGRSFGSRGSNTYSPPPATNTAPKAAPIERSMTQKGAPSAAQSAQPGASAAAQPSRFGGWRGLLMGGLEVLKRILPRTHSGVLGGGQQVTLPCGGDQHLCQQPPLAGTGTHLSAARNLSDQQPGQSASAGRSAHRRRPGGTTLLRHHRWLRHPCLSRRPSCRALAPGFRRQWQYRRDALFLSSRKGLINSTP